MKQLNTRVATWHFLITRGKKGILETCQDALTLCAAAAAVSDDKGHLSVAQWLDGFSHHLWTGLQMKSELNLLEIQKPEDVV